MDLNRILNHDASHFKSIRPCMVTSTSKCFPLRVGKWTLEEEAYALELIKMFLAGSLSIPEGTSLRLFLAKKLYCSPMRVTTKLSTNILCGQQIRKRLGQLRYFPSNSSSSSAHVKLQKLGELESKFRSKENIPIEFIKDEGPRQLNDTTSEKKCNVDSKAPVRIGTWTNEEEAYAFALINAFRSGTLNIKPGTTLRSFLADQLCCDRMRITKKLSYGIVAQYRIPSRLGCLRYRPIRQVNSSDRTRSTASLAALREMCFSLNQGEITNSDKKCAQALPSINAKFRYRKHHTDFLRALHDPTNQFV